MTDDRAPDTDAVMTTISELARYHELEERPGIARHLRAAYRLVERADLEGSDLIDGILTRPIPSAAAIPQG